VTNNSANNKSEQISEDLNALVDIYNKLDMRKRVKILELAFSLDEELGVSAS
jgi:hypothetical protein